MAKAVFLDRDGVINKEIGRYIERVEEFEILPHVPEALKRWYDAGYLLFIITNQGGIAKGLYGHEEVQTMHRILDETLAPLNVKITEAYYAPHHPEHGNCLMRKPGSMMLERAIAKYNVDPSLSVMIGDKDRDMEAASRVGVRGILIEPNQDLRTIYDLIPV